VDARTPVLAVALAPSGSTIATGSDDGTVRLWRRDGKLLHVLQGHGRGQPITDARFSPDGKRLVTASGGSSENAIEWDVASGRPLHPLVGHFGTVTAASFSADGRWLLTSGPVAGAIWSSSSGALLFYLRGPTDLLTDAEWSRAGFRVVATTRDGTIRTYSCAVCGPLSDLMGLARRRLALR
jgi:WD40 repeat protein